MTEHLTHILFAVALLVGALALILESRARRKDFDFLCDEIQNAELDIEGKLDRQRASWTRRFETLNDKIEELTLSTGGFWRTGKETLQIRDMTDLHIQNAIDWMNERLKDSDFSQQLKDLHKEKFRRARARRLEAETSKTPRRATFEDLKLGEKFRRLVNGLEVGPVLRKVQRPIKGTISFQTWGQSTVYGELIEVGAYTPVVRVK